MQLDLLTRLHGEHSDAFDFGCADDNRRRHNVLIRTR